MRRRLLLPLPLLLLGCWNTSPFAGRYTGTIADGKSPRSDVSLEISGDRDGPLRGTLTEGVAIELVDVRAEGKRLTFILPLMGKVDDDAFAADLTLEGDRLVGTMRQRRAGSEPFALELRRP